MKNIETLNQQSVNEYDIGKLVLSREQDSNWPPINPQVDLEVDERFFDNYFGSVRLMLVAGTKDKLYLEVTDQTIDNHEIIKITYNDRASFYFKHANAMTLYQPNYKSSGPVVEDYGNAL